MSAVHVVDQVRELIVRDCLLVMLENIPSRLATYDADVVGGMENRCKDRRE